MNVLPETDKQVGAILEAIREVSPQVVEQAVMYYRVVDIAWLGIIGSIVLVALTVGVRCYRVVHQEGWYGCSGILAHGNVMSGHGVWAIISGIIAGIGLIICACMMGDLACAHFAPDYYAADCMIELGRKALGK